MNPLAQERSGTAALGGVELYYEVRGRGPAVLLIAGAAGDAGQFEQTADLLASEHTVITYDRRGNSRSRTAGPSTLDQQTDDAAALLRHLGAAPAAVFGTSGGAILALRLATRAPEVARHVIVHEPPILRVLPDTAELGKTFQTQVQQTLAAHGPHYAMEQFIRRNAGDLFDRLEPALRERMIANGPWFFGQELPMFASWVPTEAELAGLHVPVQPAAGRDSRSNHYYRVAEWVANALGVGVAEMPGAHAPYFTQPREFAAALRPLLSRAPAGAV